MGPIGRAASMAAITLSAWAWVIVPSSISGCRISCRRFAGSGLTGVGVLVELFGSAGAVESAGAVVPTGAVESVVESTTAARSADAPAEAPAEPDISRINPAPAPTTRPIAIPAPAIRLLMFPLLCFCG